MNDGKFLNGDILGGVNRVHMGGAIDFVRADFRADNFFSLRQSARTFATKNFRHVERRRPNDQSRAYNFNADRNNHGVLAGGGRHSRDNFLYVGFFHAVDNFADVVLALFADFGFDGDGIWHGGDNGHNLRGDSK